jgi:hypothetical protein
MVVIFYMAIFLGLGMKGLEPLRFKKSTDFKSVASTNSATPPIERRFRGEICFDFAVSRTFSSQNAEKVLIFVNFPTLLRIITKFIQFC